MAPFALEAKQTLEELDAMRGEVESSYKRIVRSLGEDEDKLESGDKVRVSVGGSKRGGEPCASVSWAGCCDCCYCCLLLLLSPLLLQL